MLRLLFLSSVAVNVANVAAQGLITFSIPPLGTATSITGVFSQAPCAGLKIGILVSSVQDIYWDKSALGSP